MKPRHKIDKKYNSNPRHIRRWELTIEWLKQFDITEYGLDCGDRTGLTDMIEKEFDVKIYNTEHNLNWFNDWENTKLKGYRWNNVFIFEVIEHLLNPLLFINWIERYLFENGTVYLSTPINRPKWMRNKELHFHEFNYNELIHLIDVAGFKIIDEKIINPTRWYFAFTGIRPLIRVLGWDKNILLALKREG